MQQYLLSYFQSLIQGHEDEPDRRSEGFNKVARQSDIGNAFRLLDNSLFTGGAFFPKHLHARNRKYGIATRQPRANYQALLGQRYLPNHWDGEISSFDSRVYGGRFSEDGNLFYAVTQNDIIMYNTENVNKWKFINHLYGQMVQWTITDTDVTGDNENLLYSSLNNVVHMLRISPEKRLRQQPLELSDENGMYRFAVYSAKFNHEGTTIAAGTNVGLYYYDVVKKTNIFAVDAHDDDINSVCYENRRDGNIIFTASDDCMCKVWDRRDMRRNHQPQGVFIGHHEGLTHVTARGNGYHVLTNGKDQCMKLWDLRKMRTSNDLTSMSPLRQQGHFDYRFMPYDWSRTAPRHDYDDSVMTFTGHDVLQTLVRCYFSPQNSTNQRFVYTGSADGKVYIYDTLTSSQVQTLSAHRNVIRDVSWHPSSPTMVTASFDFRLGRWSYKDSGGYQDMMSTEEKERTDNNRRQRVGTLGRQLWGDDDDDEEEPADEEEETSDSEYIFEQEGSD